jgi:RNA polymerase sigma factor (sigma-70 family)
VELEALSTSSTLLGRLRDPADGQAWEEFVARYGPGIFEWCRRGGLQAADAEDTTQKILLKLVVTLRTFRYDRRRSFRGWLHTVTLNAISDLYRELKRPGCQASGGAEVQALLESAEAREDLLKRLEEEFDRELLQLALGRVSLRVEPRTWKAFEMLKIQGRPGAEVARALRMPVAHVFVYANRVVKMVRKVIAELQSEPGPQGGER